MNSLDVVFVHVRTRYFDALVLCPSLHRVYGGSPNQPMIIILMGVSASGKTTVGRLLAREIGWNFYEGDDFHSEESIARMRRGIALTDQDRLPWLQAIRKIIQAALDRGENAVIACSALKGSYRAMLRINDDVVFVYLKAGPSLIQERLKGRAGHFMSPDLLESQFDALEEPREALPVDASLPPEEIVRIIRNSLSV
ncbi:MAG: gluconokinase [Candidatus Binatia bacterium]